LASTVSSVHFHTLARSTGLTKEIVP